MRSYFRYWHEAFRLPSWSHRRIVDMVVTTNESALRDVHAQGRGAIVALPHMGNWDLAGAWACLTGLPVSTVAERLRPESLYNRFVAYRAELGMEVEPLSGAGNPLTAMRERARPRAGRLPARGPLLRPRRRRGVPARRGRPAARRAGDAWPGCAKVPVVVATPSYRGPLMHLQISDPIEPVAGRGRGGGDDPAGRRLVQRRDPASPQDWHMLQRVFVSDLDAGDG